jgi:predicted CoA-binding protein
MEHPHILTTDDSILALAGSLRRVAVLGIKTEAQSAEPAYYVAAYLVSHGVDVVPVPVYYPEATRILDRPVVRDLKDAGAVDAVIVFRRGADVPPHLPDLLALKPRAVWMQLGIRSPDAARRLAEAGIDVVEDRCVMVEHRRAMAMQPKGPSRGRR